MIKGSSATALKSVKNAKKRLTTFLKTVQTVPIEILQEEAPVIQAEAKLQAPYETGKLENNIKCTVSKSTTRPGLNIRASARSKSGYNYAGIQHENTQYHHPVKGKAHYLVDPFNEGVARIEAKMRRRVKYK